MPCERATTGYVVILIGTDGSGKTTLARQLCSRIPGASYVYFGMKEFRFRLARSLYARSGDKGWLFRYLVLPVEYMMRRQLMRRTEISILDRVPGWAFAGNATGLRQLYRWVLPTADTLVLCTGDVDRIVSRRPERSTAQCEVDIRKWEAVSHRYPARNRVMVDTTGQSREESCYAVLKALGRDARFSGVVSSSTGAAGG